VAVCRERFACIARIPWPSSSPESMVATESSSSQHHPSGFQHQEAKVL
jgi:hypothetical protein